MEKYIHVSYTYQVGDLVWDRTLELFSFIGRAQFPKYYGFPSKISPPEEFLLDLEEMLLWAKGEALPSGTLLLDVVRFLKQKFLFPISRLLWLRHDDKVG